MKWTNNIRIVSATPASESTILIDWSDGSRRLFDAAPHMRGDYFDELGDPLYFAKLRIASHGETVEWPNGQDFAPRRCSKNRALSASSPTEPTTSTQAKKMRPRCAHWRLARTAPSSSTGRRLAQVVRRMGACGQLHRRPLRRILCCAGEDRPRRQRCDLAERRRLQRRRGVRQVGRIEKRDVGSLSVRVRRRQKP